MFVKAFDVIHCDSKQMGFLTQSKINWSKMLHTVGFNVGQLEQ